MLVSFPSTLRPSGGGYAQNAKTLGGGQSLSGIEQVVDSLNGRWQASFRFPVRNSAAVMSLRALVFAMDGRLNSVALPAFDGGRAPWRTDNNGLLVTPKSRRTKGLDGTVYADSANLADTLITAHLAGSVAGGATTIPITVADGGAPQPGHMFSIANRLYSILAVTGSAPYVATVWPRVREDAILDAAVNFTSPRCEMRFASDAEGADVLKGLDQMRFGTATLNFDEVAVAS